MSYSERIRLVFHFRRQHREPLQLHNADIIAAFINTALKYTDNIALDQNWRACLDVTATQEEAASLFVCYGWAGNYREEYPRTENAFYTVDIIDGARHYNIVNDDIMLRFASIENEGRGGVAHEIITNIKTARKEKYSRLQATLKPLLWWCGGVRLGLTTEARELCEQRINDYIENLLKCRNTDDIYKLEIDKSNTDLIFAEPQQFIISLDDMEFCDYQYNITAEYNKTNAAALGAARAKNAADRNFLHVAGNEWTTAELNAQGINKDKITRLVKQGYIERVKRGCYRRISS